MISGGQTRRESASGSGAAVQRRRGRRVARRAHGGRAARQSRVPSRGGGSPRAAGETARGYLDAMRRLTAVPDEDLPGLVPVTLGAWLDEHVTDPVVRGAVLQAGEVMFPSPSEHTSVGRLIGFLKESREYGSRGFYPEDPDASGMQGLVAPWVRVIRQHG